MIKEMRLYTKGHKETNFSPQNYIKKGNLIQRSEILEKFFFGFDQTDKGGSYGK